MKMVYISPLGTKNVVSRRHVERLKSGCILANMGHSNQEIDMDSLKEFHREKIKKHVSHIILPHGKRVVLLAEVSEWHELSLHKRQCLSTICVHSIC